MTGLSASGVVFRQPPHQGHWSRRLSLALLIAPLLSFPPIALANLAVTFTPLTPLELFLCMTFQYVVCHPADTICIPFPYILCFADLGSALLELS